MPEKTLNRTTAPQVLNGIDQIRDIILGEQIDSWEKRIKKLEQSLKNLTDSTQAKIRELSARIETSRSESLHTSETSKQELHKTDDELRAALNELKKEFDKRIQSLLEDKVDKDSIGEVFIQWGQKVKSK